MPIEQRLLDATRRVPQPRPLLVDSYNVPVMVHAPQDSREAFREGYVSKNNQFPLWQGGIYKVLLLNTTEPVDIIYKSRCPERDWTFDLAIDMAPSVPLADLIDPPDNMPVDLEPWPPPGAGRVLNQFPEASDSVKARAKRRAEELKAVVPQPIRRPWWRLW